MNFLTLLLISFGLAADAFAVSLTSGSILKKVKLKQALTLGLFFGGFQMIMPILGWFIGSRFKNLISGWDHWIAFGLLVLIGGNMIKEALSKAEEKTFDPMKLKILFTLAIATSIDAMAVGFGLAFISTDLWIPVLVIGAVTFILSVLAAYLGQIFGHLFEKKVEIFGGLILIGIGTKILIEHMSA